MLVLCSSCDRHVRSDAPACPFCGASTYPKGCGASTYPKGCGASTYPKGCGAKSSGAPAVAPSPTGRLGRAAIMTFGALALSACNDAKSPNQVTVDPVEAGAGPTTTASATTTATAPPPPPNDEVRTQAKPYGAPPLPEEFV